MEPTGVPTIFKMIEVLDKNLKLILYLQLKIVEKTLNQIGKLIKMLNLKMV